MSAPLPTIEARAIRIERQGRTLLQGVDFSAARGELWALLGPNGAGKSTLLRALSGEWPVAAGEVRLGGTPLPQLDAVAQARQRAVLPQHDALSFGFTARQVVALGRLARPRAQHGQIVTDAMQATEVDGLAERRYPHLSGGERRRVQIARVLAQVWDVPSPLLLLDEPLAGLDPVHQHALLTLLRRLATRGATVVMSLHDLDLAARYASHVALLRTGGLVAQGAAGAALTPAHLAATFGERLRYERLGAGALAHWRVGPVD